MLHDPINGIIQLRDLPLCVRTSASIAAFCLNVLATPPEINDIRGLDMLSIKYLLFYIERLHVHLYDTTNGVPVLQHQNHIIMHMHSMAYTLDRATNLIVHHLNTQQRSLLMPRFRPTAFNHITDAFYNTLNPPTCPIETTCAVAIIYSLKLYYLTHCRNFYNRDIELEDTISILNIYLPLQRKLSPLPLL